MKSAAWFVGLTLSATVLMIGFSGCAAVDWAFGPPVQHKELADTNKDGFVDEQERKAAGLPFDASPWISLALEAGGFLVPGLGAAALAYKKMREHKNLAKETIENLRSVVIGVEDFKRGISQIKMSPELHGELEAKLIGNLISARNTIAKNPQALAEFVKEVTEKQPSQDYYPPLS